MDIPKAGMADKDVLKEIIARKKERIALAKQALSEEELKEGISSAGPVRPFIASIHKPRTISLIAEIKKASPSKGVIRQDFDLQEVAKGYQEAGVQAISVLTEEDYFSGSISYLKEVKNLVNVPVLRKDFIIDPYQVYESRYYGADAMLLIADILSKDMIVQLTGIASSIGLECLIEVHDEKELKKVLNLKVPAVGINNRDLHTLKVDFSTTEKLFTLIPKDKIVVVESGIKSYQDVLFLKILGVSAILVGEAFMEAADIRAKVVDLMGW